MKIEAVLNLDEIMTGPDWDTSIAEMVRDELRLVIKAEIKKAISNDKDIAKAINAMKKRAAAELMASLGK